MKKLICIFIYLGEIFFPVDSVEASSRPPLRLKITPFPRQNKALYVPSVILTKESLEKIQQTSLGKALSQVPGVTWLPTGTEGNTASLRIRGASDAQTLVLMDGIPVNDPALTTNFFNFSSFRTSGVQQVSLLPGTQSLMYGSGAIGGVVLVETLSGKDAPAPSATSLTQEIGSDRLVRSQIETSGQWGKVDYRLEGEKYRIGKGALWNAQRQVRQSDDFHDLKGSFKGGIQLTPTLYCSAYILAQQNETKNNELNAQMIPVESLNNRTHQTSTLTYARANWKPHAEDHHLITISYLENQYETLSSGIKSKDTGTKGRFHHLYAHQFASGHLMHLAVESETEDRKRTSQNLQHVCQNHLVGTYEWSPFPWMIVGGGIRGTYHQHYKDHLTYQVSTKMTFQKTTFFASFGTGFRSPSIFQLYGATGPDFTLRANKKLKPEKSRSFEIGGEQSLSFPMDSKIKLTYFNLFIDKIIVYQWDVRGFSQYKNIHNRKTHGVEALFTFLLTPTLRSSLTYTYTEGRDADTRQRPLKIPLHKIGSGLFYTRGAWKHFVEGTFVSSYKDYNRAKGRAFFTMRLGTSYEYNDRFKVFVHVENMLDRVYERVYGYTARRRGIYGGLTLKL